MRNISSKHFKNQNDHYSNVVAIGLMLDRVYTMCYRSYFSKDYIDKNSSKKFKDEYDTMPNCTSYLTYLGNKAIGSIRSCVYNPETQLSIPIMEVFEEELKNSVGLNNVIIEANKFVIDPSFQMSGGITALFWVYRNIIDSSLENKAKYLVAAVKPKNIEFYKMLYFEQASQIKAYPHLKFKTLLMICTNLSSFCEKIYSKTASFPTVSTSN